MFITRDFRRMVEAVVIGMVNFTLKFTGLTVTGGLNIGSATGAGTGQIKASNRICADTTGTALQGAAGDIIARRSTTTGVYYFGDSASTYLYYTGSAFVFNGLGGSDLVVLGNLGVRITPGGSVSLTVQGPGNTNATYTIFCQNSTPTTLMYVRDDSYAYLYATAWAYGPSDGYLKTNFQPLDGSLAKLMALKPQGFDYLDGRKNKVGFLAEDIVEILPYLVTKDLESGTSALFTTDLIPYMIKGMQEQQAMIDEQVQRIRALEMRLGV